MKTEIPLYYVLAVVPVALSLWSGWLLGTASRQPDHEAERLFRRALVLVTLAAALIVAFGLGRASV